mmetsp:Transcript_27037/g.42001  ORF Transcript_27037/g.42001 Transcript_27037/m.42001 type:complete len:268 (+) Transcript_27037:2-805(+)
MRRLVLVSVFLTTAVCASSQSKDQESNAASTRVGPAKKLASFLLNLPVLNSLSSTAKPLAMKTGQLVPTKERTQSARMDDDLAAFLSALDDESDGKAVEAAPGTTLEPPPIVTKVEEPPPAPTTSTTTEFNWNDHTTSSTVPLYIRENREETWDEKVERYRQEFAEKKRIELIRNPTTTTYEETWDEKVERYREENREKARLRNIQFPTTTTTTESWDEKVERYRKEAAAKKLAQEIANPTTPPPPEETWEEKVERYRKEAEAKKKR